MIRQGEAAQKMRAQLETMPPEQKKMMEGMMAKMMPGGASASKTIYKKTGAGGTVGGWATDKYEGIRAGAKTSEFWNFASKKLDLGSEQTYAFATDGSRVFAGGEGIYAT